jgi:hypothetical protein
LDYLPKIDDLGYNYYFQFTLTSYGKDIEKNLAHKPDIIETFIALSERIGKNRVVWRYDPIILNAKYSLDYHIKWFDYLCDKLNKFTEKCVISFIDIMPYKFLLNDTNRAQMYELTEVEIEEIAGIISTIAKKYSLPVAACSESIDLAKYDFLHNKCIDDDLIKKIFHKTVSGKKDKSQRQGCGCVESRDIGTYNTCPQGCIYCYARKGKMPSGKYDPASPILWDDLENTDKNRG